MPLATQQRCRAAQRGGRRIRRRTKANEQHAPGLALTAIEMKRFVSRPAKIAALEGARQRAAETFVERAKSSG
jgi:hypothetical protein